eukprot:jgi/Orpsp1_1/1191446/evm.model.d7180000085870.1
MDFITELQKSKNKTVEMVIVVRLIKTCHLIPFRMLPTAEIAADEFFKEIFRLHGLPDEIISDRGTQFTSEFWQRLYNWVDLLPYAEFAYNNSVQPSIKQTPFYANYEQHPKSNPLISSSIAQERYKKYADFKRQEGPKLQVNDLVWLKRPDLVTGKKTKLSKKKIGPFKIIDKLSSVSYKLELPLPYKCHNIFSYLGIRTVHLT